MPPDILYTASVWILPVLIAITFHEAAHAYVAWRLGDDTAFMLGRVSFNPFRHVDPFGTVLLPAILLLTRSGLLFGWAKPVPVIVRRLGNPRRDMVLVALAGPGVNLMLAIFSAWGLRWIHLLPDEMRMLVGANLANSVYLNVLLAVFNMLPLPPLDGGRVAVGILPDVVARPLARLEPYGMMILMGLILLPVLARNAGLSPDLDVLGTLVYGPAIWLQQVIAGMVGLDR